MPGTPPPAPRAIPSEREAVRDHALRLRVVAATVVVYLVTFSLLFGLSLLGLHWYEQDERERKRREAEGSGNRPVPVPTG